MDTPIRVPLDTETLDRLRQVALAERRATGDQAAVILRRALSRRRRPGEASTGAGGAAAPESEP